MTQLYRMKQLEWKPVIELHRLFVEGGDVLWEGRAVMLCCAAPVPVSYSNLTCAVAECSIKRQYPTLQLE